jgi:hypothetical protein
MNHIFGISNPAERLEVLQLFMRLGSVAGEVRAMNAKAFEFIPTRKAMESRKVTKAELIGIIESFGTILTQNAQFAGIVEQQFGNGVPVCEEPIEDEE